MKQALFILAVALYLVSLCACGDQTIQSKSKQGSATRQVVQERMKLHRKHPFRNRSRRSPPKRFRAMNRHRPPANWMSI